MDTICYDEEQAHHGRIGWIANSGSNTLVATMSEQDVSAKHGSTGSIRSSEEVPYVDEEDDDEEEDEEEEDDECDGDEDGEEDDNLHDGNDKQEEDEDGDEDDDDDDEEGHDSHHGSPHTQMPPPMPPYYPYPYAYPVHVQPPPYHPPPPSDYLLTGPQNPHTYTDASGLVDPIPDTRRNRGGVTEPFPEKLHRMLEGVEREGLSDVVSFFSHGRAFAIHKPRRFVSEIMLRYFRQSRLTSFQRQLNLYGFRRITQGPDNGGYYHELFLKGRVGLCVNMKRVKVKGQLKLKRDPDSEREWAL
jgi:HSF-type DNA-binding